MGRHKQMLLKTGQAEGAVDAYAVPMDDAFFQMGISREFTLKTTDDYSGNT
ncbi:MAG: hypothetical protein GY869_26770, partial [Planctomycetes bacterium]|nr:hypothetical protein [Planctomycetota bacterium]